METLITYMFQITMAFMVIQVCIPIVIIMKNRSEKKNNVAEVIRTAVDTEDIDHLQFLQEIDSILNLNHIAHYDD